MKIVHVLPLLSKGGGERVAVELSNHAAQAGHTVSLIVAGPADPALLQDSVHPDIGIKFVLRTGTSRVARYVQLLPWLWRNRGWLMQQDIIHCHLTYGSLVGMLIGKWRKISRANRPMIVETYHSVGMGIPAFNRWVHARLAAGRDGLALMAEDTYWRRFIAAHGNLTIKIIPNGVSLGATGKVSQAERDAYRKQIGIPDDCRLIVGTVGMMRPDRKPWLLIPIFAEVARVMGPDIHFLIAGGGPEIGRVKSLAAEHGLEGRVHLPGLVIKPQLPFSLIDLYVTLNVGTLTGIAALEAALTDCPLVAIQLSSEFQRRPDDWIWSSADPMEMAGEIVRLLRSAQARRALANDQSAHVRANHTTDVMAEAYYDLYRTARERSQIQ